MNPSIDDSPRADAAPPVQEHLFYDGDCGVCFGLVRFVAWADRQGRLFRFAPVHGETFDEQIPESERQEVPDSLVVRTHDGELLYRTPGLIHILKRLGGPWPFLGGLLFLVPRPLRDFGYDRFAAIRHHFNRRPEGSCPIVPPELRARFDP